MKMVGLTLGYETKSEMMKIFCNITTRSKLRCRIRGSNADRLFLGQSGKKGSNGVNGEALTRQVSKMMTDMLSHDKWTCDAGGRHEISVSRCR